MKYGLLGGTFDPPHNGHLQIAMSAQRALGLSEIVFMAAKQPPHKLDDPVTPLNRRVAMLKLALKPYPDFVISLLEAKRTGPSYSVDTLRELRATLGDDAEIFFIMGMDSLQNLPTWHKPQEIVRLCRLAVLKRPGYAVNLAALEESVPGVTASVIMIDAPEIDVSASEIRDRVRRGESIKDLVPRSVASYIKRHHLYQSEL